MFGWLREMRSPEAQKEAGWSGVMSLPRVLTLQDGELSMDIAPEVEKLRGELVGSFSKLEIEDTNFFPLNGIEGNALEIQVIFLPGTAKSFGITLRRSPSGEEETLVGYDVEKKEVFLDSTRSSLDNSLTKPFCSAHLELLGKPLFLRIFVDHSVIEVFINHKLALSTRIYPTRKDSEQIGLFSKGGKARVDKLECWRMKSIW